MRFSRSFRAAESFTKRLTAVCQSSHNLTSVRSFWSLHVPFLTLCPVSLLHKTALQAASTARGQGLRLHWWCPWSWNSLLNMLISHTPFERLWLSNLLWEVMCVCMLSCLVVSDSLQSYGLCSLPGSSMYGILQAWILDWVAMLSSWPRDWTRVSYVSCIGRQVLYH